MRGRAGASRGDRRAGLTAAAGRTLACTPQRNVRRREAFMPPWMPRPFPRMDDARRNGLTRRDALALGALAGAATLARGGAGPAAALAAPRSLGLTVAPDAFGSGGVTAPLRAPGRFVLLGVRDPGALDAALQVRARLAGGRWTGWHPLHGHAAHGPDRPGTGPGATDPLWTGPADELQLRATRRPRRPVQVALVAVPRSARALIAGRAAAAAPTAARGAQLSLRPPIVPRASWGGDLVPPRVLPSYGEVSLAIVHHTESANAYTQEQSAAVVLAITKFHRDTRGWNDVGYNFLVDRFGTIYEGRAGGVDLPVIGAHAQGFNGISAGIAIIGSFTASEPPAAALDAVARLIGWRLPLAGVPVLGDVSVRSSGGSLSRYRAGAVVTLARISGHRDVGSTDCPGDRLYVDLPDLRARTRAVAGAPVVRPEVTLAAAAPRVQYGGEVRFEGSVLAPDKTPQPGIAVRIEKRGPAGSWVKIAQTTTDADGAYAASAAWTRGGLARAAALEAVSLPVAVGVVPALEVAADATSLPAGGAVILRGRMRPPGTVTVVVQRRSRGRWQRVATVRRKARGAFSVPVRLRRPGRHRLLVSAGSTGQVASARPIAVRVGPSTGGLPAG